jgi:hypothetical protein
LYKLKLALNNNWIFVLGSFVVVLVAKLCFDLCTTVNKVGGPVLAYWRRVIFSKKKTSHFLYRLRLGRKSAGI